MATDNFYQFIEKNYDNFNVGLIELRRNVCRDPYFQSYSLPTRIINYLMENARRKLLKKLAKLCKSLLSKFFLRIYQNPSDFRLIGIFSIRPVAQTISFMGKLNGMLYTIDALDTDITISQSLYHFLESRNPISQETKRLKIFKYLLSQRSIKAN